LGADYGSIGAPSRDRLLGKALDTPPDPQHGIAGGLTRRPPDTPWPDFVADFKPHISPETPAAPATAGPGCPG